MVCEPGYWVSGWRIILLTGSLFPHFTSGAIRPFLLSLPALVTPLLLFISAIFRPQMVVLTKYIYIKSTTVYVPSSELGLSHPLSRQRVCPSPRTKGGGGWAHSPADKGLGESQFRRLKKNLALCLLCGGPFYTRTVPHILTTPF